MTRLTLPLQFEQFSGEQFERLVFAYHLRAGRWQSLQWYGRVGSDLGRDIVGRIDDDRATEGRLVCIQCVNRGTLTASKIERDVGKAVAAPTGRPDLFRFVSRANVSAALRDRAAAVASAAGIRECEIWSGVEFEERLRADAESLLARFFQGVEFPDDPAQLQTFVSSLAAGNDRESVALIARLFDRPAFYTPFSSESSIPAFKQAITDTIEAMNTGLRRTRDGVEIGRIPSRHDVADSHGRVALAAIEHDLAHLRARFDELILQGEIKHCSCGREDCSLLFATSLAAAEMDRLREELLEKVRRISPGFTVRLSRW